MCGSIRSQGTIAWLVFNLTMLKYGYISATISFFGTLSLYRDKWLHKGLEALTRSVVLLRKRPRGSISSTVKKHFRTIRFVASLGFQIAWLSLGVFEVFYDRAKFALYIDTSRTDTQT